jgi:hypothetical protein
MVYTATLGSDKLNLHVLPISSQSRGNTLRQNQSQFLYIMRITNQPLKPAHRPTSDSGSAHGMHSCAEKFGTYICSRAHRPHFVHVSARSKD